MLQFCLQKKNHLLKKKFTTEIKTVADHHFGHRKDFTGQTPNQAYTNMKTEEKTKQEEDVTNPQEEEDSDPQAKILASSEAEVRFKEINLSKEESHHLRKKLMK